MTEQQLDDAVYQDWLLEFSPLVEDSIARHTADGRTRRQAIHLALVADRLEALRRQAESAYAERQVSKGYWAREAATLLSTPGYSDVDFGGLRHPSHREKGTIYVRPSKGGRWGKSREEHKGQAFTEAEELRLLARKLGCPV